MKNLKQVITAVSLAVVGFAANANLVTNGDFEAGSTGWTFLGMGVSNSWGVGGSSGALTGCVGQRVLSAKPHDVARAVLQPEFLGRRRRWPDERNVSVLGRQLGRGHSQSSQQHLKFYNQPRNGSVQLQQPVGNGCNDVARNSWTTRPGWNFV